MNVVAGYKPVPLPPGSRCTRGLESIPPEDVPDFIANDHLCVNCRGEEDHEYAARVIAAERQSTVPAERGAA